MSGALVEGTTLAFLGLCAAGQRPACDGELDGAVRWRVRGGERDDLFSATCQSVSQIRRTGAEIPNKEGTMAFAIYACVG